MSAWGRHWHQSIHATEFQTQQQHQHQQHLFERMRLGLQSLVWVRNAPVWISNSLNHQFRLLSSTTRLSDTKKGWHLLYIPPSTKDSTNQTQKPKRTQPSPTPAINNLQPQTQTTANKHNPQKPNPSPRQTKSCARNSSRCPGKAELLGLSMRMGGRIPWSAVLGITCFGIYDWLNGFSSFQGCWECIIYTEYIYTATCCIDKRLHVR